jgi:hypothetical protein
MAMGWELLKEYETGLPHHNDKRRGTLGTYRMHSARRLTDREERPYGGPCRNLARLTATRPSTTAGVKAQKTTDITM